MSEAPPDHVITGYLQAWRAGDEASLQHLTAAVYNELRRMAAALMGAGPSPQIIQPTELVHELYFRLPGVREMDWRSRAQFLCVTARIMRNILVDQARKRQRFKRGGGMVEVNEEPSAADPALGPDVLLINDALDRFAVQYPRQAQVVELRFFGGLTAKETTEVLEGSGTESSLRTVERDWTFARAWLQNAIGPAQSRR